MKTRRFVTSSALALAVTGASMLPASAQDLTLDTLEERAGYTIGVNIGMGIASQGFESEIDIDAVIAGIRDVLGDNLQMSSDEMMAAIREFTEIQEARMQALMEADLAEQAAFLAENAQEEGVVTTESGLQYKVLEKTGDASAPRPETSDRVNVHYHGMLIDGTIFDSSVERGQPLTFRVDAVIAGWTEGLQLMQVGDKYRLFIPADLAYGRSGAGDMVPPNATLIFDVELLGIE